jgi:hypothetical protein
MRRIVSILFFLCFAWSQAAAADCPMAGGHADGVEHAGHAKRGGAHAHHAPAPEHDHAPAQHAAPCGVVMPCGTAALPSPSIAAHAQLLVRARAPRAEADAYLSPIHTADPPPPRLAVLA